MKRRRLSLLLSLPLPLLLLSACAGNPGPWQWVEMPKPGVETSTGLEIPGLELRFVEPTSMTVFDDCREDVHLRDEAGTVPVLSCTASSQPELAVHLGASTSVPFPDDAAVLPMQSEYQAAGWTVLALGDETYYGKSGIYAHLQNQTHEAYEFRFFAKGVTFIAHVEFPQPNDNAEAIEHDFGVIVAGVTAGYSVI